MWPWQTTMRCLCRSFNRLTYYWVDVLYYRAPVGATNKNSYCKWKVGETNMWVGIWRLSVLGCMRVWLVGEGVVQQGSWYGVVSLVLVTIACLPWYGGWDWHAEGVTAHFSLPPLSICKAGWNIRECTYSAFTQFACSSLSISNAPPAWDIFMKVTSLFPSMGIIKLCCKD